MNKKLGITLIIIFAVAIFIKAELDFNPSVRVLASVINFSESTLKSDDYLAYNIDLKDLFRNYTNADVRYSGSAYIKQLKSFPYSISGSIKGERSPEQKKFSCKADLDVLVLNVGKMDLYAKDSSVYLVAPILVRICSLKLQILTTILIENGFIITKRTSTTLSVALISKKPA